MVCDRLSKYASFCPSLNYRKYMEKVACVCGASALELYRASKRLIPTLLDKPRTGSLRGCTMPPAIHLADEMQRYGVAAHPYHLLLDGDNTGFEREDVIRHIGKNPLPPRALIKLSRSLYVASPELLFLQLATFEKPDVIDLIEIGYELCGTYVLDNSWDGLTEIDKSLTSTHKIGNFIEKMSGSNGVKLAKQALCHVNDRSNSPMESVLAMLVSLPTRMGGLGLGPIALNHPVATPLGPRRPDILFTKYRVGLEYKGKEYHSVEAVGRDDRRQNKLVGSGVTILNVWYEDLVNEHLFEQLTTDLFRALGIRKRIRAKGFETKQALLRLQLMPVIERFG